MTVDTTEKRSTMGFARRQKSTPTEASGTEPEAEPSRVDGKARKWLVRVRTLLVLGVTCGAALWAVWVAREMTSPAHQLAGKLRDGTVTQRRAAVGKVGQHGVDAIWPTVPALVQALRDKDQQVAMSAVSSLKQALQAARNYGSGDPAAARTAVTALTAALKDPRPDFRMVVAMALADAPGAKVIGDDTAAAAAEALVAALSGDTSVQVREAAAEALGELRSEHDRATVALLRALGKDEPNVHKACAKALWRLKDHRDPGESKRTAAIVPALIERLADREPQVRSQTAAVLGEIGPEARASITALIGMLNEAPEPKQPDAAGQAALALGEIAPATPQAGEAVTGLIAFLRGTPLDLRRAQAAESLARFGPELTAPVVPVLIDVLKEIAGKDGPPGPQVCKAIGRAAPGSPQADQAVAALSAALNSSWGFTRTEAAQALARFGSRARSALPKLHDLAKSDRERVVRDAAAAAAPRIEGASDTGTPE
jgi:HEAT repeat protein